MPFVWLDDHSRTYSGNSSTIAHFIMKPQIRLAGSKDAESILKMYAPFVENTVISFELEPPTAEEVRQRIKNTLTFYPWLVCEYEEQLFGYAYAGPYRSRGAYQWSVEVSAYVCEGRRRSGIGRALYTSLFAILIRQGFHNALAGIALPNVSSVGFHDSMGFESVGVYRQIGYKLGAWRDVGWWQRRLQAHSGKPQPPIGIQMIKEMTTWDTTLQSGLHYLKTGSKSEIVIVTKPS